MTNNKTLKNEKEAIGGVVSYSPEIVKRKRGYGPMDNHVYNEDCLVTMARMRENYVDLTVTHAFLSIDGMLFYFIILIV